jgi:hypothetical protein
MVAGRGRGFSVQKNLALFGVIAGQDAISTHSDGNFGLDDPPSFAVFLTAAHGTPASFRERYAPPDRHRFAPPRRRVTRRGNETRRLLRLPVSPRDRMRPHGCAGTQAHRRRFPSTTTRVTAKNPYKEVMIGTLTRYTGRPLARCPPEVGPFPATLGPNPRGLGAAAARPAPETNRPGSPKVTYSPATTGPGFSFRPVRAGGPGSRGQLSA